MQSPMPPMRFMSGGCDRAVKLWTYNDTSKKFIGETIFTHDDWVRDVAFANNIGLPYEMAASCSEDKSVTILKKIDSKWVEKKIVKGTVPVWRVSWSLAGNLLAVAGADNVVHVYEEKANDKWEMISEMSQNDQSKS